MAPIKSFLQTCNPVSIVWIIHVLINIEEKVFSYVIFIIIFPLFAFYLVMYCAGKREHFHKTSITSGHKGEITIAQIKLALANEL